MDSFTDLKYRAPIGLICGICVALLIFFSSNPILQLIVVLAVAAIAITAVWEYSKMLQTKEIEMPFWLLAIVAGAFVIANYLAILNASLSIIVSLVVAAFFFAIFLYNFYRIEGAIVSIATSFFGALYIVVPLGLILRILYPHTISDFVDGRLWLTYLIVVTKITDVGAYFIGKLWGKSKLAPMLSPGKTLMGAIAGFISAVCMSMIFFLISTMFPSNIFTLTFPQSVVLGGVIGIFSQLGDLAESLLKRDANVKDSNSIPGFGGVLDFLDSLLFTAPILYLFLRSL